MWRSSHLAPHQRGCLSEGLEPPTPCLQSDVFACRDRTDLVRRLSASSREIPQLTPANGTLMARDLGTSAWRSALLRACPRPRDEGVVGADAALSWAKIPVSTRILRWRAMVRWVSCVSPETQPARWLEVCPTPGRLRADSTERSECRLFSGARELRHPPQAFQRRRGPCCERSLFSQRSSAPSRCPRPEEPRRPRQSSHCRTTRPTVGVSLLVHPLQCLPSTVKGNAVHT
jgi:hypothetical protein